MPGARNGVLIWLVQLCQSRSQQGDSNPTDAMTSGLAPGPELSMMCALSGGIESGTEAAGQRPHVQH